ncbi:hypothetical protein EVAR_37150_1 [Eumeta japonica]|uniref:Uncharacterized protein n=1 Tax=Eumeta variegata TaxID=151549 RepID=A0A4C1WJ00_EUMVA|nr:hypothetical protein EVAR_37150_1 [Eumeta japonica]
MIAGRRPRGVCPPETRAPAQRNVKRKLKINLWVRNFANGLPTGMINLSVCGVRAAVFGTTHGTLSLCYVFIIVDGESGSEEAKRAGQLVFHMIKHKNDLAVHKTLLSKVDKPFKEQCVRFYNKIAVENQNSPFYEFKRFIERKLFGNSYYTVSEYINENTPWD